MPKISPKAKKLDDIEKISQKELDLIFEVVKDTEMSAQKRL